MNQIGKNSFGMGVVVFFGWFFIMFFYEPFGPVDLIGAIGTAFGFGFGTFMASYVMSNDSG